MRATGVPFSRPLNLDGKRIGLFMIQFACGQCATKFRVKDEFAGKATKCPTCKRALNVPSVDMTQAFATPDRVEGTRSTVKEAGVDAEVSLAGGSAATALSDKQLLAKATGRYILQSEIAR